MNKEEHRAYSKKYYAEKKEFLKSGNKGKFSRKKVPIVGKAIFIND